VDYQDRTSIATPEGVELHLALAGLGSRSLAVMIDLAVKMAIFAAVIFVVAMVVEIAAGNSAAGAQDWTTWDGSTAGTAFGIALVTVGGFLVVYGYETLFEAFRGGQTPGKQVLGVRVVLEDGSPIGFRAAAIRNLLLIVDGPLTLYTVGAISIVLSKKDQRLGDLAAGTIVVRERFDADPKLAPPLPPGVVEEPPPPVPEIARAFGWDVSAVSERDLSVVRSFLDRRRELDEGARQQLAEQLAQRLRPKVAGIPEDHEPEEFLEVLVDSKARAG